MILWCYRWKVIRHDVDSISFRRHTYFKMLEKKKSSAKCFKFSLTQRWKMEIAREI